MTAQKRIFEEVYDYERLMEAFQRAKTADEYKEQAQEFSSNLEENLINIQNHLIHETYEIEVCLFRDYIVEMSLNGALKRLSNENKMAFGEDMVWLLGLLALKNI